jgi:hypothetical protein
MAEEYGRANLLISWQLGNRESQEGAGVPIVLSGLGGIPHTLLVII